MQLIVAIHVDRCNNKTNTLRNYTLYLLTRVGQLRHQNRFNPFMFNIDSSSQYRYQQDAINELLARSRSPSFVIL